MVERGVLGAASAAVCEAGEVEGDVMTSVLVERGRERERDVEGADLHGTTARGGLGS